MNGVWEMTETLSGSKLNTEQREIVDIINDILDVTKIEACKLKLEPMHQQYLRRQV